MLHNFGEIHRQARQPISGGAKGLTNIMDKQIAKVDGEEFIVTKGSKECELDVTNGNDTGIVTWHKATQQYRGAFKGWGSDTKTVERAVEIAARQIIKTRTGISQQEACEGMDKYLKG